MAWLAIAFLLLIARPSAANSLAVAKPGCTPKCGDIDIPFPFGIGHQDCSLQGFHLNCSRNATDGTYKLFHGNVEVLEILLATNQARLNNHISWQCSSNVSRQDIWHYTFNSTRYRISSLHNKFVVIGCDTLAYNTMLDYKSHTYRTGCVLACYSAESLTNGSCSGMGRCETPIPPGITSYRVSFDRNFNSSLTSNFSRCSYAVVMEADNFTFVTSYVTGYNFWNTNKGQVPILLNWHIGNAKRCEEAKLDTRNYACVSANSNCTDVEDGPGYVCYCSKGYEGNPYLKDGCQGNLSIPL